MASEAKSMEGGNDSTLISGTLIRGVGSFYYVTDEKDLEYTVRCKKKFRRDRLTPLVGDRVLFSPGRGEEHGWLEEILPRKTVCLRPAVANVNLLVIVIAPVPEPDFLLVDRQISRAMSQGMEILIAVNKTDLDDTLAGRIQEEYAAAGIPVFPVCARYGSGLKRLRNAMEGDRLCCFTGQSGAGKSSLLNALLDLSLQTGGISRKISRGKNTTRHTELIRKNGLKVIDTPGFNLLEPENQMKPEELKERYPEFRPYEGRCRFRECLHDKEPGCAVAEALKAGEIGEGRLSRYRMLLAETRDIWRNRYD